MAVFLLMVFSLQMKSLNLFEYQTEFIPDVMASTNQTNVNSTCVDPNNGAYTPTAVAYQPTIENGARNYGIPQITPGNATVSYTHLTLPTTR